MAGVTGNTSVRVFFSSISFFGTFSGICAPCAFNYLFTAGAPNSPRVLWHLACKSLGVTECIVGCCGWTQAQEKYVKTFDAIELQTTFYQPPGDAAARKWKLQAPPAFRFCMKAWQLITHTPSSPTYRRLKFGIAESERELYGNFRPTEQVALAWQRTREIANIIDAHVIVFQ